MLKGLNKGVFSFGQSGLEQGCFSGLGKISQPRSQERYRLSNAAPLGIEGMLLVQNQDKDDHSVNVGDIGFDFPNYGDFYRNNIYVVSNSYITFGYNSTAYSGLTLINPGRGIFIAADDRSYQRVYVKKDNSSSFRIRFEGATGTTGTPGSPTLAWEVTLFDNGTILVVPVVPVSSGNFYLTKGDGNNFTDFPSGFAEYKSIVFLYNQATNNYTALLGDYAY